MLAAYFDSIMMFAVGAYATALAFGRLPPPMKDVVAGTAMACPLQELVQDYRSDADADCTDLGLQPRRRSWPLRSGP